MRFFSVGQEVRDRISGAVEAFARRNASGSGHHGEHSKHKIPDDAHVSSKEVVSLSLCEHTHTHTRRS